MKIYTIKEVCRPDSRAVTIEAHDSLNAVARVAGCSWRVVGLPIWREKPRSRTGGTRASAVYWQEYDVECFMPFDDTGRQWVVTHPKEST